MIRPEHFQWRHFRRGAAVGLVLLLTLCLGLRPHVAAGQTADVQSLIERGQQAGANTDLMRTVASRAEQAGLSSDLTASLLEPAVSLAEQDLPTTLLLNKTLEGLSKQVPPSRIPPVLQHLQTHTEQSGQLVSAWTNRPDVRKLVGASEDGAVSSADRTELIMELTKARQQDVPAQTLEQFLNRLPEATERRPIPVSEVSVAVSILPDLPGNRNGPPEGARQMLTAALDAGYDAESLRQLPAALESARRASNQPVSALARGTARAIEQGTPATSVLQSLFQGGLPGKSTGGVGSGKPETVPGQGKPPGKGGRPPGTAPPNEGDPPGNGGPPGSGSGSNG